MVVFQKLEGKTTTLNFWNQKLEGKTTTLKNWIKRMEGNSTTPKNCVLTNFLHERSIIFLLVFSLIQFWILLRNAIYCHLKGYCLGAIHKRRLLKGGGRGVKNVGIYLVKRRQMGREGGHKIGKMGRRRLWMAPNKKKLNDWMNWTLKLGSLWKKLIII